MSGFKSFVKISNFRETNISIYLAETCQQRQKTSDAVRV